MDKPIEQVKIMFNYLKIKEDDVLFIISSNQQYDYKKDFFNMRIVNP